MDGNTAVVLIIGMMITGSIVRHVALVIIAAIAARKSS